MAKLALADGAVFGWRKLTENDDGSNMIRNGLACKSGTARYNTPTSGIANQAICFTILYMESDGYDNDPTPLPAPYRCSASGDKAKCRYYYGMS